MLYCVYWGAVTVFWIRILFPGLERCIGKIPQNVGVHFCNITFILLAADGIISLLALKRYAERKEKDRRQNRFTEYMDGHFPDARMEKIYSCVKTAG